MALVCIHIVAAMGISMSCQRTPPSWFWWGSISPYLLCYTLEEPPRACGALSYHIYCVLPGRILHEHLGFNLAIYIVLYRGGSSTSMWGSISPYILCYTWEDPPRACGPQSHHKYCVIPQRILHEHVGLNLTIYIMLYLGGSSTSIVWYRELDINCHTYC